MSFINLRPLFKLIVIAGFIFTAFSGCDKLSIKKSLGGTEFSLIDQDQTEVTFPESYSGRVMLVGYVYTHCPDICPLITYNMRDIQRALPGHQDFLLVSISFDPDRDTPEILYDYAENYRLEQSNWRLLTGSRSEVESLLEILEISTVKTPTRFTEDNTPIYFIDHTDRVTLIDGNGNIRKHYKGSDLNPEAVAEDIQTLLNEVKS
jgi:protein SCO1/2